MGNVIGKVRKNFYIGIRVPWTLASDRVWNDTHRLAAWVWVAAGVIGFAMIVLGAPIIPAIAVLVLSALVPVDLLVRALQITRAARSVVASRLGRGPRRSFTAIDPACDIRGAGAGAARSEGAWPAPLSRKLI